MAIKKLDNNSLGILYTERRSFLVDPMEVRELWTDIAPYTTIAASRGLRQVPDPDFKMFEHRSGWIEQKLTVSGSPAAWATSGLPGETLNADAAATVTASNLTADSSLEGMVVEIWDSTESVYKGIAVITAYSSGVKLKALGNPRASNNSCSALAAGDILYVIGTAFGEGTTAPDAFFDDLEVVYNSTQIFKTSVEVTGTLYAAALKGYSSELERLRVEKSKEHKMQKERAFLFGTRVGGTGMKNLGTGAVLSGDGHSTLTTDADSNQLRTTQGIIPAIFRYGTDNPLLDKQNIFNVDSSTYNLSKFIDDMEKVFLYQPEGGVKYALCGPKAYSYWSKVASDGGFLFKSGIQLNGSATMDRVGIKIRELDTPHGTLALVKAPVFRGPYSKTMLIVDPADLWYAQYRQARFDVNIKTEDQYDGEKDAYFSDEGVGMTLIEKHSVWTIS